MTAQKGTFRVDLNWPAGVGAILDCFYALQVNVNCALCCSTQE